MNGQDSDQNLALHDGSELELLRCGAKPLAAFSFYDGADEISILGQQDFASAVRAGQLLRFEKKTKFEDTFVRHVLFTRPDEAWRASAYMQLVDFMYKRAWCAHLEWIQGSLLGYSDKQNSDHIREKYGNTSVKCECN